MISHSFSLVSLTVFTALFAINSHSEAAFALPSDCNGNGVSDATDVTQETSKDCNKNSIPDECDVQPTGLKFDYQPYTPPDPAPGQEVGVRKEADFNDDGRTDYLLMYYTPEGASEASMFDSFLLDDGHGGYTYAGSPETAQGLFSQDIGSSFVDRFRDTGRPGSSVIRSFSYFMPGMPHYRDHTVYLSKLYYQDSTGQFVTDETNLSFNIPIALAEAEPGMNQPTPTNIDLPVGHADFNHDSLADLVLEVRRSSSALVVMLKQSGNNSNFDYYWSYPNAKLLNLADWNKDGNVDILASIIEPDGNVQVMLFTTNNAGEISPPQVLGIDPTLQLLLHNSYPRFADLNGDGTQDLYLMAKNEFAVSLAIEKPSLAFGAPEFVIPRSSRGQPFNIENPIDVDGDGSLDFVSPFVSSHGPFIGNFPASVGVYALLNNGKGHFDRQVVMFVPYQTSSFAENLAGDSKPDIYSRGSDGSHWVGVNSTSLPLVAQTSLDINHNSVPDECERATAGDYDGDRKSDLVVGRTYQGLWYWFVRHASGAEKHLLQFGLDIPGYRDILYSGDYDGDGRFEPGVVRSMFGGLWWISALPDDGQATITQWGLDGDIPLTGYFDQDRKLDLAVVRKQNGGLSWYIRRSSGAPVYGTQWGLVGDKPFAGDLDGDGIDDLIVMRDGQGYGPGGPGEGYLWWYARTVSGKVIDMYQWGLSGDTVIAPYDWNGDGRADYSVVRPNMWPILTLIRYRDSFGWGPDLSYQFGLDGDIPMAGAYSGTKNGELLVYRTSPGGISSHYISKDNGLETMSSWGLSADTVVLPSGKGVTAP